MLQNGGMSWDTEHHGKAENRTRTLRDKSRRYLFLKPLRQER